MLVKVELKNPPSGANRWGLTVYDWTGGKSLGVTITTITGVASFDIPSDWVFPLRFWISVIYYPDGSVTVLHQAQSLSPSWLYYVEEFIPSLGSYYYNVATGEFELIEAALIGTITDGELDYQNIWQRFPLLNIPVNTRIRIRITGRNDTLVTQRMGIHWFVADPDGGVVQEYSAWEAWPYTGAGVEHQFIGSSFDLSKVGQYTMQWILLLMNPDDPEVVDRYIGNLCTVKSALVPTFSELAIASFSKV